jgi:hypothetical protein
VGEVAGSGDKHLVEAFGAQAADPAFGDGVRAWCLGWVLMMLMSAAWSTASKVWVNLVSRSRMRKSELLDAVAGVHQEVPGLLGSPSPIGAPGHERAERSLVVLVVAGYRSSDA